MRVLIVDDDIATLEMLRDTIDWLSYNIISVRLAYNLESAKRVLCQEQVELIISDIEMPMGNGTELIQWVRENEINCEFIFLTCHEEFTLAKTAIQYGATDYLIKPLSLEQMSRTLKIVTKKIEEKRAQIKSSEYGRWVEKNKGVLMQSFWRRLFLKEISSYKNMLEREVTEQNLELDLLQKYRLIHVQIDVPESVSQEMGGNLLGFALEKLVAENVLNRLDTAHVTGFGNGERRVYLAVDTRNSGFRRLQEGAERLIFVCERYYHCRVTCCISEAYSLWELADAEERITGIFMQNVTYYGRCFGEKDVREKEMAVNSFMDGGQMGEYLQNEDKAGLMNYIKMAMERMQEKNVLTRQNLYVMQQELLQAFYIYMYENEIAAGSLFMDNQSQKMQKRASESMFDMIKWVNYATEEVFRCVQDTRKNSDIVKKIEAYVQEHYQEGIGRNEIAASLFISPEYLSKVYKKDTGMNLKDYISRYRVGKAKTLLLREDLSISEVAERVGFENFSYFSTFFKKSTSMTPNEYRKRKKNSLL